MEIAEKGETQPRISPKRMKSQQIVEDGEEDRISRLPDCLLLEILSRLPSTIDAINTGPLSKRWERLWTLVPTLIFPDCEHSYGWVVTIYEILGQCRQLKLKRFQMHMNGYDIQLNSDINSWIGDAIKRNVEELNITLCDFYPEEECELVDKVLFMSSSLTDLTLRGCNLNPRGTITWINLRSLRISRANLDEKVIENILLGSPALETLVLDDCYGFRRLDINSKSVKNMVLSGYIEPSENYGGNMIEINAPNISSLTIEDVLELFKVLLVNMSSLVKANLNYRINGLWEITHDTTEEEMLKGHIVSLRHVKEVNIGSYCSQVVSRLKAKGFDFPSNIKFS